MPLPTFNAIGQTSSMTVDEALRVADEPKPDGMLRNEHVAQMRSALIALADEVRRLQHTENGLVSDYVVNAIGDLARQASESSGGANYLFAGLDRAHAHLRRWQGVRYVLGATYAFSFPSIEFDPTEIADAT